MPIREAAAGGSGATLPMSQKPQGSADRSTGCWTPRRRRRCEKPRAWNTSFTVRASQCCSFMGVTWRTRFSHSLVRHSSWTVTSSSGITAEDLLAATPTRGHSASTSKRQTRWLCCAQGRAISLRVTMRKAGLEEHVMTNIQHRTVETNGIRMHVAEQGTGPLVVLCHGFPESWYSWRHQLRALAEAGFRAVAPDMRGYGETDRPGAIDQYTLLHLVGDMVGLVDALGAESAVIVGHDWGAPVAWHAALLRPDRFRAVIGLSVPYRPRGTVRPTTVMPQTDDALVLSAVLPGAGRG